MELLLESIELLKYAFDFFLHLDKHLTELVNFMGPWTYVVLFLVIFAETGLVFLPLLPGDSLLFAIGAIAALPDANLNVMGLIVLLFCAAGIGDAVNYAVGRYLGPRVLKREDSLLLNRKHLEHTQSFYERHGGKTIILARFVPIVRTFAPFVAGVGNMRYRDFAVYNLVGAFFWVIPFVSAGYFFGNLPFVKDSFHYLIVAIIFLSVLPGFYEIFKARNASRRVAGVKIDIP